MTQDAGLRETLVPLPAAEEWADLRDCLSPASFWLPEQIGPQHSWVEHAPFAFWLVEALRPRIIVELGTHGGFSYFTLCQAVQRLRLDARCHAVDTWKGDEHAGFYGEAVYEAVCACNDRLYSAFSTLIRCTFDEALGKFDDGSVDLLHIDGRHRLADVKHDFETWRPKLSGRAVVLFHDTNVREGDFGVFEFWAAVSARYPHFEFLHGHGLGVLGVGRDIPEAVGRLFSASTDDEARTHVRAAYGRLGSALALEVLYGRQRADFAQLTAAAAQRSAEAVAAESRVSRLEGTLRSQSDDVARLSAELAAAEQRAGRATADAEAARAALSIEQTRASGLEAALENRSAAVAEVQVHSAALAREVAELRASTSWRITAPLRWARRLLG